MENRRGAYEVIGITTKSITIRYNDGSVDSFPSSSSDDMVRISENITSQKMKHFNIVTKTASNESDWFYTLGALAAKCNLYIHTPPKDEDDEDKVRELYFQAAGEDVPHIAVVGSMLFGPGYSVFFHSKLLELSRFCIPCGSDVKVDNGKNQASVNTKDFFYSLVEVGFRVGFDQNTDDILERIPKQYQDDFIQGCIDAVDCTKFHVNMVA